MSLRVILCISAVNLTLVGCGGKEESVAADSAPRPVSTLPALTAPTAPPAGGVVAGSAKTHAPPPAFDFASSKRELDRNGNPISDLEMLNQLVMSYAGRSMSMAAEVKGESSDPDAQIAAMSKQYLNRSKPLRNLSELVTVGVIKALPEAPAGKQYVLDPKTMTVIMTDRK